VGEKNTKNAIAMWAKDGEYVNFSGACDCTGKVSANISGIQAFLT
jgi:hypothetical protein